MSALIEIYLNDMVLLIYFLPVSLVLLIYGKIASF